LAFAKVQFRESARGKDGSTLAAHLNQAAKTLGGIEVDEPEIPEPLVYLWQWFLELHAGRSKMIGLGTGSLTYADLYFWASLTDTRLHNWETTTLMRLDAVWLDAVSEK